jgi:hypothetical protein
MTMCLLESIVTAIAPGRLIRGGQDWGHETGCVISCSTDGTSYDRIISNAATYFCHSAI